MAIDTYIRRHSITGNTHDTILVGVAGVALLSANTASEAISYLQAASAVTYVQPGLNITTGGTAFSPIIHVSGSPVFTAVTTGSLFGTTVTATTLSSGATELSVALSNKFNSAYAPITVQNQWVQPGLNMATGGTNTAPIIRTLGDVVFTGVTVGLSGLVSRTTNDFSLATNVFTQSSNAVDQTTFNGDMAKATTWVTCLFVLDRSMLSIASNSDFSANTSNGNTRFVVNRLGEFTNGIKVTGSVQASASISAATFYSGTTDVSHLLGGQSSSSSVTGLTTINFGFSGGSEGDFTSTTVSNASIQNGSHLTFKVIPSNDHSDPEDSLLDGVTFRESDIVNGVSFILNAFAENGTWGIYNVVYKIIN